VVANGEGSIEDGKDLEGSTVDELKQAIADLTNNCLSENARPGAQKLGKALRMLMVPDVDQEMRLEALLAVLLKPDASVEEFGKVFGMPIVPGANPESQERFLEGSRSLLLVSLDDVVDLRQHPSTKHDNLVPAPAARVTLTSKDSIPLHTEIDWRTSEAHQQLLLNFVFAGSVDEIRTKLDWEGVLGEALDSAISKLKASGALYSLDETKWHILYKRSAEELVKLCRDHGLNAFGTKEELAERLVSIDTSGLKLGYPGELLTCSRETRRLLADALRQPRANDTADDTAVPQWLDPFDASRDDGAEDDGASGRKQLDVRKPECPYCHKVLAKVPGRKTKCLHCGEFMFVRTRPGDCARVVVTQATADVIEHDWSIVTNAAEPNFFSLTSRQEVEEEREKLKLSVRSAGQQEPSDDEVKWSLLNKWSERHAAAEEWGLYKSMELSKAAFLTRRCKFSDALGHYLYVCALDLNGATSKGFDTQRFGGLYPYVLDQVTRIIRKLQLSREEIGNLLKSCYPGRNFPLSVGECWSYLQNALWPPAFSLREDVPVPGRPDLVEQLLELPCGTRTILRSRSLLPNAT
jgi:hypothetical protein